MSDHPEPISVPLSALQHYLYCPRQCALIHVERLWAESRSTAEGRVLHEKAHDGPSESRPGIRIARGLEVRSERFGLHGVCDVVEIHDNGSIAPVEYKRGKPKLNQADEVQLCGQAICLEETFSRPMGSIATGYLFYGKRKRRTEVALDDALRERTMEIAAAVRAQLQNSDTPSADYSPALCDHCSLFELCQPKALRFKRGANSWFQRQLETDSSPNR